MSRLVAPVVLLTLPAAVAINPVTRVVELLKALSVKVEEEGKTEEDLFVKYRCWGKSNIAAKEASNEKAASRIEVLTTYIADVDAGRIEFTTERKDLEKELDQLNSDIEAATRIRDKENADFEQAKDEMEKAIAALQDAGKVLAEASEGHEKGTLIALKNTLRSTVGFKQRAQQGANLAYAVELGQQSLSRSDAFFLARLLNVDVKDEPTPDWKKLNRKATFKMSYKARSFKIQEVLAKLKQTFQANLDEAVGKEEEAKSTFDKLLSSKTQAKQASEEALTAMVKESGAAGLSRSEAEGERNALNEQVSSDQKFIDQLQASLKKKGEEWEARSTLRSQELAAISKAIQILSNDDARDLFKKSHAGQGYFFLQESSTGSERKHRAVARILSEASSGDGRLVVLASMASKGHFDEVVAAIDRMVAVLKQEEAAELERKETCEANRMSDTRAALDASRKMDELTDAIVKLKQEIADAEAEIEDKQKDVKSNEEALATATEQRQAENSEFEKHKKDDEDAIAVVQQAEDVLKKFYQDNGLVFAQRNEGRASPAGGAPPPPPSTWQGEYKGATGESMGIVAALEMIKEDIQKDIAQSTQAEQEAEAAYEKLKANIEGTMQSLNDEISELEGTNSDKERQVQDHTGDRQSKLEELNALMATIKDVEPGCDYFTINYPLRTKNRQNEIDGLTKAKAILQGASFTAASSSFLQQRTRI